MTRKIFGVIFLLIILSASFSCRTSKSTKIIGTWDYVTYTEPNDSNQLIWEFYAGDLLKIYDVRVVNESVDTSEINFLYSISGSVLDIYAADSTSVDTKIGDVKGEYWVDKLNKEVLLMTRKKYNGESTAAYLRIELEKQ